MSWELTKKRFTAKAISNSALRDTAHSQTNRW